MTNPFKQRLYRSRTNRKLAGVAGGMAEYFDIDATLMRLLWVLGAVLGHVGVVIAYLVLWAIMPQQEEPRGEIITRPEIIDG